ncbi:MAG: hypothetical protein KKG50_02700, partial [Candidatus Omnitrophica bacterium]|nr:hypothetical protein [Candidatus Omnitrophota bacterium]
SQLKVFFKELREIKAVIKDSAVSIQNPAKKKKEPKAESRKLKAVSRKGRKMKFRPEITRVKLNPEQAVLTCNCFKIGEHESRAWRYISIEGQASKKEWHSVGLNQMCKDRVCGCTTGGPYSDPCAWYEPESAVS